MAKYITKSGDMWDWIAFKQMGSEKYTEDLLNANRKHLGTFIFGAGVELNIPDVETAPKRILPPWFK